MKKYNIIALCLMLAACAGGTGPQGQPGIPGQDGTQGAPGLSAYEIWLNAGNTGTEQDFLDSLVGNKDDAPNESVPTHYKNTHEYLENDVNLSNTGNGTYTEHEKNWDKHNGYKQYIHEWVPRTASGAQKYVFTYNEKELALANYGVRLQTIQYDFENEPSIGNAIAYIHNRDGIGANIYTPEEGAVFTGGTLAYLSNGTNDTDPTLIKGDSKFTYKPTGSTLELDFEDWYTITISSPYNNSQYAVSYKSWNSTGNKDLEIKGGTNTPDLTYHHIKKNDIEETVGTYHVQFDQGTTSTTDDLHLRGAFGGTKQ